MVYLECMTTAFTVGRVARLAGITVRTLHHYDDIGLLPPSGRATNGYRSYDETDIERLQQILAYRELGLGLDEIARAIDATNDIEVLAEAQRRIRERLDRLSRIAANLDSTIEARKKGIHMTPEQRLEAFGDFDPDEFADEAKDRWGGTPTYDESVRRTSSYTSDDWKRYRAEASNLDDRFLALMDAGIGAESDEAAQLVDAHRSLITRWFYECTPDIHAGLGAMYASDPRFRENIDKAGAGLAEFLSASIAARYRD